VKTSGGILGRRQPHGRSFFLEKFFRKKKIKGKIDYRIFVRQNSKINKKRVEKNVFSKFFRPKK
jgi:hypothetical protein